jgi:magnesium-protoporphyrin O-methyltransferase
VRCSCKAVVDATARHFDEKRAREVLASFRKSGPVATTQGLLRELAAIGPRDESLLDVGSGIGVLSLGLLESGVRRATAVDISPAALRIQGEEARRRGLAERVELHEGDFVALARELPAADLVTLDRVVCCYPDYGQLLDQAAGHCRRRLALSFPRDRWWVRLGILAENLLGRLRGDAFRVFVHPPSAMAERLRRHGLTRRRSARTWTWQIEVYERAEA